MKVSQANTVLQPQPPIIVDHKPCQLPLVGELLSAPLGVLTKGLDPPLEIVSTPIRSKRPRQRSPSLQIFSPPQPPRKRSMANVKPLPKNEERSPSVKIISPPPKKLKRSRSASVVTLTPPSRPKQKVRIKAARSPSLSIISPGKYGVKTLLSPSSKGRSTPYSSQMIERNVVPVPGVVLKGSFYKTLEEAQNAIYKQEERLGHTWVKNQSKTKDGRVKKMTFRCNRHALPKPKHDIGIDPADHRHGKSGKIDCQAHVNVCRNGAGWLVTTTVWEHNHERTIPEGGSTRRPPTQEQRSVVADLATLSQGNFTRTQIGAIVKNQAPFKLKSLEPRQISNIMCQARRDAREHIQALGGDINAITETLRRREEGEGWRFNLKVNEAGTVVIIWWQTRQQFELVRRFHDILLNDNTYNRNNCNYPLNIGIGIDSHGRSRNVWYALQEREDAASFSWILRCHLDATDSIPPEIFASDRHGSLIKAVSDTLPLTRHILCLQHLGGNVVTMHDEFLDLTLSISHKTFGLHTELFHQMNLKDSGGISPHAIQLCRSISMKRFTPAVNNGPGHG